MLCPLVFVGTINDEDCDLQGPSSVAGWLQLAGWPPFRAALRPRSKRTQRVCVSVACTLHCGYNISASSVLVGARTHIKLTCPNGPLVAVGHVHHNNKSIHCLNHSGGDNHPERALAARCGSHSSLNERHVCWHSDPPLDRERHKGARCHSHLRPHGERRRPVHKIMARQRRRSVDVASCGVLALLPRPELVENRHRHDTSYVSSRPKEGVKESPRPIDRPIDRLSIAICQKKRLAYCLSQQPRKTPHKNRRRTFGNPA